MKKTIYTKPTILVTPLSPESDMMVMTSGESLKLNKNERQEHSDDYEWGC